MHRRKFLSHGAACLTLPFSAQTAMSQSMTSATPHLHVPPEEAPHSRTFMQWPVSRRVHPDGDFLDLLQHTIADIANAITQFEPVTMLAAKQDHPSARRFLSRQIDLWDVPTEDLWCRDSGPLFAIGPDGDLVVSHLQFNGWGGKQVHKRDGKIARRVAEILELPVISSGLIGEAGGVEHDGHGLLMAHESSWHNPNRNPGLSRIEIEQRLLKAYGAHTMIWSKGVYDQDITDYHIDSLARFTGPGRVLINLPAITDPDDPFHRAAIETHNALVDSGMHVETIPEPVRRRVRAHDFVASYANYYVCNSAVIAAQFGDQEADQLALEALERHYPNRQVVTLNVDALGEIGGGIHCATQQMPAV